MTSLKNGEKATRLLLVSDAHGNSRQAEALLKRFGADRPDALLFAGDGADIVPLLSTLAPVYAVKGNCDPDSNLPLEISMEFAGHKLLLTHGHRQRVKQNLDLLSACAKENEATIAIYGHTHHQGMDLVNRVFLINPGTLWEGQYALLTLREGNGFFPTFCTL